MAASINGIQGTQGQQTGDANQPLRELDLSAFIKLMVTELQNQDPLNPMENSEILQQISQIREIESSDKLTGTLDKVLASQDSVLLGQNLTNASALIGKKVTGNVESTGADGEPRTEPITGVVDRVSLKDGAAKVHIGDMSFPLKNVVDVWPK